MYKSKVNFQHLKIFKEDLLELDYILKEKFKNKKIVIKIDNKNSEKEYTSFEEFYDANKYTLDSVEKNLDSIHITITNNTDSYVSYIEESVSIYITKINVSVTIESKNDEIWVNGLSEMFKNFFTSRKSIILNLASYVSILGGACIGIGITSIITSLKTNIISILFIILGMILGNRSLVMKIFPTIKISLNKKETLNKVEIVTIFGVVISLASLVFSVILSITGD